MSDKFAGIADRVREVIEASRLTHRAFAAAVEMEPDKLSKSLAGSRRFTSLELALIAETGDVTVDWLLTGRKRPEPLLAARTAVDTPASLDGAIARAQAYDDVYDTLERVGHGRAAVPLPKVPRKGRNIDQGEALAEAALAAIADAGRLPDMDEDLPHAIPCRPVADRHRFPSCRTTRKLPAAGAQPLAAPAVTPHPVPLIFR